MGTATLDCRGCAVDDNTAAIGGGIAVEGVSQTATVDSSGSAIARVATAHIVGVGLVRPSVCMSGNSAERGGGFAVTGQGGALTMTWCDVSGNTAKLAGGGGLVSALDARVAAWNATFTGNRVTDAAIGRGGALVILSPVQAIRLSNLTFSGNDAAVATAMFWSTRAVTLHSRRLAHSPGLECEGCIFDAPPAGKLSLATEPVSVQLVRQMTGPVAMGLALSAQSVGFPVIEVVDWYGNRATQDRTTTCQVMPPPEPLSQVVAGWSIAADGRLSEVAAGNGGRLSFSRMIITGRQGTNVTLRFACDMDGRPEWLGPLAVPDIAATLRRCPPGYSLNSARQCQRCSEGTYSPEGSACLP